MRTEVKNDIRFHYSECGMYECEQETKHFFYVNDLIRHRTLGQINVLDKELLIARYAFRKNEMELLNVFLKEIFEYYKHEVR